MTGETVVDKPVVDHAVIDPIAGQFTGTLILQAAATTSVQAVLGALMRVEAVATALTRVQAVLGMTHLAGVVKCAPGVVCTAASAKPSSPRSTASSPMRGIDCTPAAAPSLSTCSCFSAAAAFMLVPGRNHGR